MAVLATVFATGADADHVAVGWGANGSGQVGDGTFDDAPAMVAVDAAGALQGQKVVDIDAGSEASCAVTDRGAVACWGLQRPPGEPPVGVSSPVYMDTASLFPGAVATAVEVGDSEICALGSNGRIGCWSSGRARLLGGVLADHSATQISMGRDHGCAVVAVRYDRVLACWGTNDHGQLGDGTRQEREQPAFVDTSGVLAGETIVDVSAADDFTCAMTRQDRIACWGASSETPRQWTVPFPSLWTPTAH